MKLVVGLRLTNQNLASAVCTLFVSWLHGSYTPAVLGTRNIFVDASHVATACCFINASRVTVVFFLHFGQRHHRFAARRYALTLLAVKLSPFHPTVILHPCWRPSPPLPTQRSSSTHPACNLTLSFTPAVKLSRISAQRHPSPLLLAILTPPHLAVMAVKLSPLRPAVILHPC